MWHLTLGGNSPTGHSGTCPCGLRGLSIINENSQPTGAGHSSCWGLFCPAWWDQCTASAGQALGVAVPTPERPRAGSCGISRVTASAATPEKMRWLCFWQILLHPCAGDSNTGDPRGILCHYLVKFLRGGFSMSLPPGASSVKLLGPLWYLQPVFMSLVGQDHLVGPSGQTVSGLGGAVSPGLG